MPKVSVCIPIYNVEQYIGRCIESVISQNLKDIEIIIVNDCTPDNSMEIVRQYAATDDRIKIIEHDINHGLMMARRTGYMAAVGEYIIFLDSDDTLAEGALETLYVTADKEKADIVSGTIQYVPNNGERYIWNNELKYGTDRVSVFKSLLKEEIGHNLCSKLFKKELLQDYKYQTFEGATNGEDAILFYQVVNYSSKVIAIDRVVYEYYQNSESSSHNANNSSALNNMIRALSLQSKMIPYDKELGKLWKKYCYLALTDICRSGNKLDQIKPLLEKYDLNISLSPLSIIMHCRSKAPSCLYHLFLKK